MDKKGYIHAHSKEKLELYKMYLDRYLAVLLNQPYYDNIEIYDIFAGCGISDNNEEGSAVIAAKIINENGTTIKEKNKTVTLTLNELDKRKFASLEKSLKDYSFISFNDKDADNFVSELSAPNIKTTRRLFFIDPHGYTKISTDNLKALFSTNGSESLIFIPISHIYRFIRPPKKGDNKGNSKRIKTDLFGEIESDNKKRKPNNDQKYHEPVKNFLEGLGITGDGIKSIDSVEQFAEEIKNAIVKISNAGFVNYQIIQSSNNQANKYALFFISHNVIGAEKFLEIQKEIEKKDSFDLANPNNNISKYMYVNKAYTNVELHHLGIKNNILPAELGKQMKDLEKDGKVKVEALPNKERKRKAFYLNNKEERLKIIFTDK